jgi:putative acetyltransferase
MIIREATRSEIQDVLAIHQAAFGSDIEAELVQALLNDPSAKPLVSLLAVEAGRLAGHILFTRATLTECKTPPAISILAPLAVVPDAQKKGIGGELIKSGLHALLRSGVMLVFVLGYPEYYQRYGFIPAGGQNLQAPFPIPAEHADAWMVQALQPGLLGTLRGKVMCADTLNKPEYWRE